MRTRIQRNVLLLTWLMLLVTIPSIWVFYDPIAIHVAQCMGMRRPLFHDELVVPEDRLLPRWTYIPAIWDDSGNVLFADFHNNLLVLIRGVTEETRLRANWFDYYGQEFADNEKAVLLPGTAHETTVVSRSDSLVVIDQQKEAEVSVLPLTPGQARTIYERIVSARRNGLAADNLSADVGKHTGASLGPHGRP